MKQLLDFSARLIEPEAIKAAGYAGVIGYFSESRPGANFGAKPLTRDYCDQLRAAGLEIVTNWQFNKGGNTTSDFLGGYDAGCRNAENALRHHFAAGGPAYRPIYCSIDAAPTLGLWNDFCAPYIRGWASVVGLEWTGIYANRDMIDNAIEDGVASWFWQHNWLGYAGDNTSHPAAHIHQIEIDKRQVGAVGVDVNNILKDDYGQWSAAVDPGGEVIVTSNKPEFDEIDYYAESNSNRRGARVTNGLGHTQEGGPADGSGARNLADYLSNTNNGVSYHDVIGNGEVFHVVPKDRSSWSVLDANPYTINYCLAGSRAGWNRDQWLERRDDIRIMAWLMVQDAQQIGYDTAVIAPPYEQRDGLSDHRYVTDCLGFGTHTDMGREFPWDVLESDAREFATGAPAGPPPNAINDTEAQNPWLGARLTAGEQECPDEVGRYAEFQHGHIYWHPSTGAHAIPASLFGKYSEMGWEAGLLGYPIGPAAQVEHGEVQAFQRGAIYRQDGREPFVVRGAIRARWHRLGSETGALGWPVSDEQSLSGGEAAQRFEHGQILWGGPRDTVALLDSDGPDSPVPDHD